MKHKRLFLCGGAEIPDRRRRSAQYTTLPLLLWGPERNIVLKITDIHKKLLANVPDLWVDLLEIASYVLSADQTTPRGGSGVMDMGEGWRRRMCFVIAVRRPEFWASDEVKSVLRATLDFLSDDAYDFEFVQLAKRPPIDGYFEFARDDAATEVDEIVLFSGGLDSLAGAIHELFGNGNRVALVSHRSAPKIAPKQQDLYAALKARSPHHIQPVHVPVWMTKDGWQAKENTQRTRSFLYASLAAVVAMLFRKRRIRFYENGITSLNLPIVEQIVGARATRTTHPRVMAGLQNLFSLVSMNTFSVETPFIWRTKTDILELMRDSGLTDFIKHSVSCSHVFGMTRLNTHCGCCSQCIDRRLAAFAADCVEHDPDAMYKTDVFIGERSTKGQDIVLAESYIRAMTQLADMTEVEFFARYGEVNRAVPYLAGRSDEVAQEIYDLHKRNGEQVRTAIKNAIRHYADDIAHQQLPSRSLLRQVFGSRIPKTAKRKARKRSTPRPTRRRAASGREFRRWDKRGDACFVHRQGSICFFYKDELKTLPFRAGSQAPHVITGFLKGTQTHREIQVVADSKQPASQIVRNINRTINEHIRKVGWGDVNGIAFICYDDQNHTYALEPRVVDFEDYERAHINID